jgi:glycosyltransferase involved in cell wall biosynthesis
VAPRVRALRDALTRLLDDPDLRRRVAAGGAALGAGRIWRRIAERHRELYDRVLGVRREPAHV